MLVRILLTLTMILMAGCSGNTNDGLGNEIQIHTDSFAKVFDNGPKSFPIRCASKATLTFEGEPFQKGGATLTLKDGQGIPLYSEDFEVNEALPDPITRSGTSGTWVLSGQLRDAQNTPGFTVTVSC